MAFSNTLTDYSFWPCFSPYNRPADAKQTFFNCYYIPFIYVSALQIVIGHANYAVVMSIIPHNSITQLHLLYMNRIPFNA